MTFRFPVVMMALVFALTWHTAAQAGPKQTQQKAVEAAKAWLAKVDKGQYGKSWDQAAAFFRQAMPRDKWIEALNQVRKPLGKRTGRKLLGAKPMTDLPNAPKGQYMVIQFSTDFANKPGAVETVTPMKEKDGVWRVSGYFIK